ncbi:hypothetical protein AVEN_116029-1, partial [Araneus ventricosus]
LYEINGCNNIFKSNFHSMGMNEAYAQRQRFDGKELYGEKGPLQYRSGFFTEKRENSLMLEAG